VSPDAHAHARESERDCPPDTLLRLHKEGKLKPHSGRIRRIRRPSRAPNSMAAILMAATSALRAHKIMEGQGSGPSHSPKASGVWVWVLGERISESLDGTNESKGGTVCEEIERVWKRCMLTCGA
jgi:hypothetical protein